VQDVQEEIRLGPNGGLVYCLEHLMQNLDFLTDALDSLSEEYLIIFDVPGQIELYSHIPVLPELMRFLTSSGSLDIRMCALYLQEATAIVDRSKFFSGSLVAMSAMLRLEVPHINVLSKYDLVKDQVPHRELKRFMWADPALLDDDPEEKARRQVEGRDDPHADPTDTRNVMRGTSFRRLNKAVAGLIQNFGMVGYKTLDSGDEDSVGAILSEIDFVIQYHEAQEPREVADMEFEEPEED
jgi:GPN-loop GTPase